jgi:hypothetical protein
VPEKDHLSGTYLYVTGLPKSTTVAADTSTGGSRVEDNTPPATKIVLPDPGTKFKVVAPTVVVRKGFLTTSSQVRRKFNFQ